jgi:putative peptidoglycan lipid II flippase
MDGNRGVEGGQPPVEARGQLARAAGVLAGLTLVSRIAGLARDVVMGAVFGASADADAFFVAFRIPNLFRRIVAEGATSTAFVPVFTSYRDREGPGEALRAASAVGGVAMVVLVVLVTLGWVFADGIVSLFAPGFAADPAKRELTVHLTASTFPYLALVGMAAWAMGTLHTFRRFATPALGPILLNLSIIVAALTLSASLGVAALVVGVLVGGVLQFLVQVPSLRALGMRPSWLLLGRHPAVTRVGALLVPTLLGGAVYQVNILVATMFASLLPDRSVSYLWYADRLFEFPLGIVAVAVGTAALPSLSSYASARRYSDMAGSTAHALQLVWSLCIPATVGLWLLAPEVVATLFERGEFSQTDTLMTARALRAYAVGMFGVASVRVLVAVFYALERPRVPVMTAVVALAVNALCDLALMGPVEARADWWGADVLSWLIATLGVADLDHVGLALGTGISATVNALLLFGFAYRTLGGMPIRRLARSAGRHLVAAAAMAVAVGLWSRAADTFLVANAPAVELAGGLVIGFLVYVAVAVWVGSAEIREMFALVRRR